MSSLLVGRNIRGGLERMRDQHDRRERRLGAVRSHDRASHPHVVQIDFCSESAGRTAALQRGAAICSKKSLKTWPVAMPAAAASHIRSQYLRTTLGLEGSHAGRKGAHVFSAVRQSIGLPVRVLCHELSLIWANWFTGRSPSFSGRRQPSRDGTSRMMREYQVRIWCSEASCHSCG